MIWQDRIVINTGNSIKRPAVKRPHISLEFVVDLMAQGWSEEYILFNYPEISRDDIRACLNYGGKAE